ncbi:OprD family outer membrane porin [Commensalibacter communis]|uniref:OprD family outer membrane porin n=1 Tax=Commensalibacter communis TaxID=2972786 RepID=UPI0022FF53C2|nr:OprD family outer membrane porin [Commensalibacter communis]CAI3945300.1 unnamed protein product [Commensalibacter communis]CAI3945483.1 unnamed protein product [Commensalibacter communis]
MLKRHTKKILVPPFLILHSIGCNCAYCSETKAEKKHGFWADSVTSIVNRTVYDTRKYPDVKTSPNYATEWGYGLMASFQSGFTPGFVGFGIDAQSYTGLKLQAKGRTGRIRLLRKNADGSVQDFYNRTGGAAKVRLHSTVAKYGIMRPKTPIFSSSDTRLLPETSTGLLVTSNEVKKLTLQIGHFTANADRNATKNHNDLIVNYLNPSFRKGKSFDFVGGTYTGIKELSLTSYVGRYHNSWMTYYINGNYKHHLTHHQMIILDLQFYHSHNTGKSYAGKINNNTASLAATYQLGVHKFSAAYQKVHGNTPFDYVTRGAIWLPNATQLSDFNGPHEQSWQVSYELDLSLIGIHGLSISSAFIRGTGIDGTKMTQKSAYYWLGYGKNGKHWEHELMARYVVPKGWAKKLNITARHSIHQANKAQSEINTNQFRVAVEYPVVW